MSLTDRLCRIEQRLDALEKRADAGEQVQEALVEAVEASAADEGEDEPAPIMSLDGETFGGDRDQSQPL